MRFVFLCLSLTLFASPSWSQEDLGLAAPPEVTASGLLEHILPRFSLKTGVRVVADPAGVMVLSHGPQGAPVFARDGVGYNLNISPDDPRQQRFLDWLRSDIGKRTVESFAPASGAAFVASIPEAIADSPTQVDGDAALGARLSLIHCGRCHVVGPENRMSGLGSTPSFAVLRAMPDWSERFETFYVLNPHPSFTQIEGITAPFAPDLPSPIVPLAITPEDLEAILAFVAVVSAADLGAPLQFQ